MKEGETAPACLPWKGKRHVLLFGGHVLISLLSSPHCCVFTDNLSTPTQPQHNALSLTTLLYSGSVNAYTFQMLALDYRVQSNHQSKIQTWVWSPFSHLRGHVGHRLFSQNALGGENNISGQEAYQSRYWGKISLGVWPLFSLLLQSVKHTHTHAHTHACTHTQTHAHYCPWLWENTHWLKCVSAL